MILNPVLYRILLTVACISFLPLAVSAQSISYIIPDIGTPGMNTCVEIVGPHDGQGNFGTDGFYLNNPGDFVRVECVNPADTLKVTIGPVVVSWNGRLVSTQIFVHPSQQPNADDWRLLQSQFVIPIRVVVNGTPSNSDLFYIVRPQTGIISLAGGVFGAGLGIRSRRGAMIVDSAILGNAQFTVSTSDPDPATPGNQGFLPFVLLSKGRIAGQPGTTITVSAQGRDAGPGGGGGGGNYCDVSGNGSDGGAGFTGGGRGGRNGSGFPLATDEWRNPGIGTGAIVNNTGTALNGVPGGNSAAYEASSGGTGHPFGKSGDGCTDGARCNPAGGFGGGSGQQQTRGGGGGGYATDGESSSASNGGKAHGNIQVIPLAGGSGGAGGNPQGISVCSGDGGGGGGAIRLFSPIINNLVVNANGADGQVRINGPGGAGSGGAISVEAKVQFTTGTVSARGGGNGLLGGAGRLRLDGPRNTIVLTPTSASSFRGPSTDTSGFVGRTFVLTGSGNGSRINLYLKSSAMPWTQIASIAGYAGNSWAQVVSLPGSETIYYLVASQEVASPVSGQYDAEPSVVLSQAAANVLQFRTIPIIAGANRLDMPIAVCETERTDTIMVRNAGDGDLVISSSSFSNGSQGFSLLSPSFPRTILPQDSLRLIIHFTAPRAGAFRDTLLLVNNDTSAARNPWRIELTGSRDSAGAAISLTSIDLGTMLRCEQSSKDTVFTIRNTGTVPITFNFPSSTTTELTVENPPAASFPLTIDPGSQRAIVVRFAPAVTGSPRSGTMTFLSTAATCDQTLQITLTARIEDVSYTAPSSISFNRLLCPREFGDTTFVITNTGSIDINITAITSSNPAFSIAAPFQGLVPAGGQTTVRVLFNPNMAGASNGMLNVIATPCDIAFSIPVDGSKDSVRISSVNLDFGLQQPGDFPVTQTLTVTNTGTVDVTLTQGIFGPGSPFSIASGIPVTIPAGGSAQILIRFSDPGADGTYSQTLILDHVPFCSTTSVEVRGAKGTAAITLIVDTASAEPGEEVEIAIRLVSSTNPTLFGATGISTTLRYNRSLIEPLTNPAGNVIGRDRVIPLTLPLSADPQGRLAILRFRAMLGDSEFTPLTLEGSTGIGGTLDITEVPGQFTLLGICRDGGTRLFSDSGFVLRLTNTPNPFNPTTRIEYELIEAGVMSLEIVDALGRRVALLEERWREPGQYAKDFDASGLPSGVYYSILRTPTSVRSHVMHLMK